MTLEIRFNEFVQNYLKSFNFEQMYEDLLQAEMVPTSELKYLFMMGMIYMEHLKHQDQYAFQILVVAYEALSASEEELRGLLK